MKADAANLTKQQVKTLIESQVNKNWSVIQSKLGFSTEAQAYAFFLGLATRESTLNAGLETGSGQVTLMVRFKLRRQPMPMQIRAIRRKMMCQK